MSPLNRLALLGVLLLVTASTTCGATPDDARVKNIFEKAARTITSRTAVPIYVPVLKNLGASDHHYCAVAHATRDDFEITLYGTVYVYGSSTPIPCEKSNAGFIASIHGERSPMPDFSQDSRMQRVTLHNNLVGWFQPVSCGGSCAPASLYWQTDKASYWLQVKTSPLQDVSSQLREMIDLVNSLEAVT